MTLSKSHIFLWASILSSVLECLGLIRYQLKISLGFLNQNSGVILDSSVSSLSPSTSMACWFYVKNLTFIHVQLSFCTATSPVKAIIRSCPDCCLALLPLSSSLSTYEPKSSFRDAKQILSLPLLKLPSTFPLYLE